jgi:uncharacterized membrane protein YgcG
MKVVNNPLRHALSLRRVSIVALTLFATACQDVPTSTPPVPGRGVTAAQPIGRQSGQVSFPCTVGNRALSAPNGWQTRRDTFYFSRGDLDARGRTVQYMYRRKATDGTLLVSVDCTVPYTESALRRVDRWLGVEANGSVAQFKAREEMVTVQGCVGDGVCTLDPLVVTPPPTDPCSNCEPPPPPPRPSGGTGGSGGDGGTGGGSGGGGNEPAYSGDPALSTDDDIPDRSPDCSNPSLEGWEKAVCSAQPPAGDRLQKVRDALARIRARGGVCANIATAGDNLLAGGKLQFYPWQTGLAGGYGGGTFGVVLNYTWVDDFATSSTGESSPSIPNGRNLESTLVHEIEHSLGTPHTTFNGAEDPYNTANSRTCGGL